MSERGRITRFGLRNFKAFRHLPDMEIRPLTVLCGANSSGKSSILQSLLLLKQTSTAPRFEGALKFSGDLVDLGTFGSVISDFDTTRTLEYRFGMELKGAPADVTLRFALAKGSETPKLCSFTLTNGPSAFIVEDDVLSKVHDVHIDGITEKIKAGGEVRFNRFWPDTVAGLFGKNMVNFLLPVTMLAPMGGVLWPLRKTIDDRLEYLGPVRADPRPFYPVSETPDIGPRGEGTIPFLLRHQHDRLAYRLDAMGKAHRGTLLDALNEWLGALQITSRLAIDPVESIAYTAAVHTPCVKSRAVNLSQVGFGISQILPVLVMGLKGPKDAFLLYEQPEIHLHPRLQAGLADFFLCAARSGKTILLETHSDHLINRLRRRIAEDETGELAKLVQILFVHAGTDDDPGSYVEPLSIDETGTIINAPDDFFPEATDEAFSILAARRRKKGNA